MTDKLTPTAGDAVRLTDVWPWAGPLIKVGAIGIIDGHDGVPQELLQVTWNYSAFRGYSGYGSQAWEPDDTPPYFQDLRQLEKEWVSCSGGPATIALPAELLTPTDELVEVTFWCWTALPRGSGGHRYTRLVRVWEWDGKGY